MAEAVVKLVLSKEEEVVREWQNMYGTLNTNDEQFFFVRIADRLRRILGDDPTFVPENAVILFNPAGEALIYRHQAQNGQAGTGKWPMKTFLGMRAWTVYGDTDDNVAKFWIGLPGQDSTGKGWN